MRSSLRLTGALLSAAILLAACGSDDGGDASDAAPPPPSTTASDAAATTPATRAETTAAANTSPAFPVTIETKYGRIEIPETPERVVSVGYNDQDTLLALGVVPVGIRDWYGDQPYAVWPWAQDALGDAQPEVLSSAEIDFEQVAALRPDLIVGVSSGMTDADYEALSAIAPTLAQTAEYPDFGVPWQAGTRLIAEAVGKAAEAEALIADVEAKFAAARAEHPEFEGASGVVGFVLEEGVVGGYGPHDSRARHLEQLGFVTPPEIASRAGDTFYASFSLEEIGLLDADVLVWITSDAGVLDRVRENPLRQQLRAATQGREVFLDNPVVGGAASFSSVLSLPYYLDEIVPRLAAAVDGDPATPTD
jgi:iron complex transport system substrate-binding protein